MLCVPLHGCAPQTDAELHSSPEALLSWTSWIASCDDAAQAVCDDFNPAGCDELALDIAIDNQAQCHELMSTLGLSFTALLQLQGASVNSPAGPALVLGVLVLAYLAQLWTYSNVAIELPSIEDVKDIGVALRTLHSNAVWSFYDAILHALVFAIQSIRDHAPGVVLGTQELYAMVHSWLTKDAPAEPSEATGASGMNGDPGGGGNNRWHTAIAVIVIAALGMVGPLAAIEPRWQNLRNPYASSHLPMDCASRLLWFRYIDLVERLKTMSKVAEGQFSTKQTDYHLNVCVTPGGEILIDPPDEVVVYNITTLDKTNRAIKRLYNGVFTQSDNTEVSALFPLKIRNVSLPMSDGSLNDPNAIEITSGKGGLLLYTRMPMSTQNELGQNKVRLAPYATASRSSAVQLIAFYELNELRSLRFEIHNARRPSHTEVSVIAPHSSQEAMAWAEETLDCQNNAECLPNIIDVLKEDLDFSDLSGE